MSRSCIVCTHKKVSAINAEIVKGSNLTELAERFHIPYHTLYYHARNHISGELRAAYELQLQNNGLDVMYELSSLVDRSKRILDNAEEQGHKRLELSAVKELRNTLELISRIAFAAREREDKQITIEVQEGQEHAEFIRAALETLSPLERSVYRQLNIKMISGIQTSRIPGIDYEWEGRLDGEGDQGS